MYRSIPSWLLGWEYDWLDRTVGCGTTVKAHVWFYLPPRFLMIDVLVRGLVVVWWLVIHATCQTILWRCLLGLFILFFYTFIYVAVNVDVHPSSYSFHMEISSPGWRWGEMYSVLAIVDNKGLRFSYAIWVSWVSLPSGSINLGPCVVFTLFTQRHFYSDVVLCCPCVWNVVHIFIGGWFPYTVVTSISALY